MWIVGSEAGREASMAAETNAMGMVGVDGSWATRQSREGWMRSWTKNETGYWMGRRADWNGPGGETGPIWVRVFRANDNEGTHV
jgi:hypothetical protein